VSDAAVVCGATAGSLSITVVALLTVAVCVSADRG